MTFEDKHILKYCAGNGITNCFSKKTKNIWYENNRLLDLPDEVLKIIFGMLDMDFEIDLEDKKYCRYIKFKPTSCIGSYYLISGWLLKLQHMNIIKTQDNCSMLNGHSNMNEKVSQDIVFNTNSDQMDMDFRCELKWDKFIRKNFSKKTKVDSYKKYTPKKSQELLKQYLLWYFQNVIMKYDDKYDYCDFYKADFTSNVKSILHYGNIKIWFYKPELEFGRKLYSFEVIDPTTKRICINSNTPCLVLEKGNKIKLPIEISKGWGRNYDIKPNSKKYGSNFKEHNYNLGKLIGEWGNIH